jgi:hypothetical protein
MSKQKVHFAALGYEPLRMKPVHLANGFFLTVKGRFADLELLNKTAVIKANKGLLGDYIHEQLLDLLKAREKLDPAFNVAQLRSLRAHINGIANNDEAVYPAFRPYSPAGNDYSIVSDRFLTSERRTDGFAGHFLYQVLRHTNPGQQIIDFADATISRHQTPIERLTEPLLDDDTTVAPWENPYPELFGTLVKERLDAVAALMQQQTAALAQLCANLNGNASHQTQLRALVVGLCAWLFIYIQKSTTNPNSIPLLVMDFLGGENRRLRTHSRNSFTRQREIFFSSYQQKWDSGELNCTEAEFNTILCDRAGNRVKNPFAFLDQHFSDLAVRIGFAQPRAAQARRKHFELQPDTARTLMMSVISPSEIRQLSEVAQALRATWGVCFGGCEDDQTILQNFGYTGLDQDADLEPNSDAFVDLLKRLSLASEPSDGLVLCAANPEELL